MGKILSWVLLIAFAYAVMRLIVIFQRKSQAQRESRLRRDPRERSGTGDPGADDRGGARRGPGAADGTAGEPMLACAHCGVYAPASEMLAARGRHYCCAEHRDADAG